MTTDTSRAEMNAITHQALRRDLERLAAVLENPVGDRQRQALVQHTDWMMNELERHHVSEDEGIWPRTLAKRPDLQPLFDEMEAEHAALAAAGADLQATAHAFGETGSDQTQAAFAEAVRQMQQVTLPHLEHEEEVAMPLVLQTLDAEDWEYLHKHHFRAGMSIADAGRMFMWLLDDLDAHKTAGLRGRLPRPMLWTMERLFGGSYDRAAAERWGDLARPRS